LLLLLTGILGKMTISTIADAFQQMIKAAQQIILIGAMAASRVGAIIPADSVHKSFLVGLKSYGQIMKSEEIIASLVARQAS
jgi:hypothetical protein